MKAAQMGRTADKTASRTLELFKALLGDYEPRNVAVRLWDGSEWPGDGKAEVTWVVNDPSFLKRALQAPTDLALGEAYIRGDFDVEGDVAAAFPLLDYLIGRDWRLLERLTLGLKLSRLPDKPTRSPRLSGRKHSPQRDRAAVQYHYDVSNDFYALWLDKRMVYSCGYFTSPDAELDQAQLDKLDYLCRKLRLQPGERLLDIGCGWGGLIRHAAQHYGVDATGITLSQKQAELAERRIQEAGLAGRCRVSLSDYRTFGEDETYDKIVSVGMFEHVGAALLPTYFYSGLASSQTGGRFSQPRHRRDTHLESAAGSYLSQPLYLPGRRTGDRSAQLCKMPKR